MTYNVFGGTLSLTQSINQSFSLPAFEAFFEMWIVVCPNFVDEIL